LWCSQGLKKNAGEEVGWNWSTEGGKETRPNANTKKEEDGQGFLESFARKKKTTAQKSIGKQSLTEKNR